MYRLIAAAALASSVGCSTAAAPAREPQVTSKAGQAAPTTDPAKGPLSCKDVWVEPEGIGRPGQEVLAVDASHGEVEFIARTEHELQLYRRSNKGWSVVPVELPAGLDPGQIRGRSIRWHTRGEDVFVCYVDKRTGQWSVSSSKSGRWSVKPIAVKGGDQLAAPSWIDLADGLWLAMPVTDGLAQMLREDEDAWTGDALPTTLSGDRAASGRDFVVIAATDARGRGPQQLKLVRWTPKGWRLEALSENPAGNNRILELEVVTGAQTHIVWWHATGQSRLRELRSADTHQWSSHEGVYIDRFATFASQQGSLVTADEDLFGFRTMRIIHHRQDEPPEYAKVYGMPYRGDFDPSPKFDLDNSGALHIVQTTKDGLVYASAPACSEMRTSPTALDVTAEALELAAVAAFDALYASRVPHPGVLTGTLDCEGEVPAYLRPPFEASCDPGKLLCEVRDETSVVRYAMMTVMEGTPRVTAILQEPMPPNRCGTRCSDLFREARDTLCTTPPP